MCLRYFPALSDSFTKLPCVRSSCLQIRATAHTPRFCSTVEVHLLAIQFPFCCNLLPKLGVAKYGRNPDLACQAPQNCILNRVVKVAASELWVESSVRFREGSGQL